MRDLTANELKELLGSLTPEVIAKAYKIYKRPVGFFQALLLNEEDKYINDKQFSIVIKRHGAEIARYVNPAADAHLVLPNGHERTTHALPYTKEKMVLTPTMIQQDLLDRKTFGEQEIPYEQILENFVVSFGKELWDRIFNLIEAQLAEQIQTGVITVEGKDMVYEIDLDFRATHFDNFIGTDSWMNAGSDGRKIAQLEGAAQRTLDDGAGAVKDIFMGTSACANFLNDSEVKELIKHKVITMLDVDPVQFEDDQAAIIGHINRPGFRARIWTHSGFIQKVNGVPQRLLDEHRVVLRAPGGGKRYFGLIMNLFHLKPADHYTQLRVADDGSSATLQMESSVVAAIDNPDGIVSIDTAADA